MHWFLRGLKKVWDGLCMKNIVVYVSCKHDAKSSDGISNVETNIFDKKSIWKSHSSSRTCKFSKSSTASVSIQAETERAAFAACAAALKEKHALE